MFDELPDKTTSPPQLSVQPMVTVPSTDTNTDALESCVSDGSADVKPRQTGETKFPAVTSQLAAYNFEATMSSFESNHCFGAVAPLKLLAIQ